LSSLHGYRLDHGGRGAFAPDLRLCASSGFCPVDATCPLCSNDAVHCGRILALDYGSKNIGLATSDELGVVVRPLPSIPNLNRRDLLLRLKAVAGELGIQMIVVGIPLHMNGSSGEAVTRVRRFMEMLRAGLGLPLHETDERLSTVEAAEIWRTMSARQQKKYRTLDSLAAAFILERFLRED
jgi:putative holliday junction resolvase